jgi:hypothetical protein
MQRHILVAGMCGPLLRGGMLSISDKDKNATCRVTRDVMQIYIMFVILMNSALTHRFVSCGFLSLGIRHRMLLYETRSVSMASITFKYHSRYQWARFTPEGNSEKSLCDRKTCSRVKHVRNHLSVVQFCLPALTSTSK